jgi:hypothetical protein
MPDPFDFRKRLMADPRQMDVLYRYTKAEVGGQGRNSAKAFMESATNRADHEGKDLDELFMGSRGPHSGQKYYPGITHERAGNYTLTQTEKQYYDSIAEEVKGGSNIANFATGNASGKVGFAGGPRTASHGKPGLMENYGIEGWTADWARSKGYTGALPVTTSIAGKDEPAAPEGDVETSSSGRTRITVRAKPQKADQSLASVEPDFRPSFGVREIEGMPVPQAPDIRLGRLKVPDYG